MSKKVLVVSSSLRKESNSEILADSLIRGAVERGHEVGKVTLRDKSIDFCKGCLVCQKTGRCVIADDAVEIAEKMLKAEVVVFATPIYYYEMSGQMKTMLDRANPLFGAEYSFGDIYLLATAADDDEHAVDGAKKGLEGWISCFERARLAGVVFAGGVDKQGEIKGRPAEKEAYQLGLNI